jgi:predicted amidohydrolase
MKVLIGQPIHEKGVEQLEKSIKANQDVDIVLFPEGYLSSQEMADKACILAKAYKVNIITSYRKENKDRALIINSFGEIILERAKTLPDEEIELYEPIAVDYNDYTMGYLLCMEILKGVRDLEKVNKRISFIAHPIGVGMFSEEQFDLWLGEARKIAAKYNTIVFGTSHADGSYRNCGISIPIAYCVDTNGEPIFIAKSDTKMRIVDLHTGKVKILD